MTSCQKDGSINTMKAMAVGEFKTHSSEILGEVMSGKKEEKKTERKIGILEGKMSVKFADDFAMTTEELCNL